MEADDPTNETFYFFDHTHSLYIRATEGQVHLFSGRPALNFVTRPAQARHIAHRLIDAAEVADKQSDRCLKYASRETETQ